MNLQSEISYVRSVVAEPYRSVAADSFILDTEIARWIYMSELVTFDAMNDFALANGVIQSNAITLTTVDGISSGGDSAINWSRIINVYGTKSGLSMRGILVKPEEFFSSRKSRNFSSPEQDAFYATVDGQTLLIYSNPSSTPSSVKVSYLRKPIRRERWFHGTTTSLGGLSHLFCTSANIFDDTWFQDLYIEITSGSASYGERVVSAFTKATGRFDVSVTFGSVIQSGVSFDVGQPPSLPEEYAPVWLAFACGLALTKKRPELAQGYFAQWTSLVQEINTRYARGTGMVSPAYRKLMGEAQ